MDMNLVDTLIAALQALKSQRGSLGVEDVHTLHGLALEASHEARRTR